MMVVFKFDGLEVQALNGGPEFKFTEAISLSVKAETQEEIDYFWDRLGEGRTLIECGWIKDKFGLAWLGRLPPNRISSGKDASLFFYNV